LAAETEGRRARPAELTAQAQPHLSAVAALLRAVIGVDPDQATRGAINAQRAALDAAHGRLLEAVRIDRSVGPGSRYALYHQIAALRDEDPLPGTLAAIVALLTRMEEAHAAILAGAGDADAKVDAFEAAVAELSAIAGDESGEP
jgi:hypothetical protein